MHVAVVNLPRFATLLSGYMNYVYLPNVFYIDILQNIIFFRTAAVAAAAVAATAASRFSFAVVHFIRTFVSGNEAKKEGTPTERVYIAIFIHTEHRWWLIVVVFVVVIII